MKKGKIKIKYFTNNDELFYFQKRDDIKIINIEFTHNFKIKVTYVIIK